MPQDSTQPHGLSPSAAALFAERYGEVPGAPPVAWNAVIDRIFQHRSIRGYVPDGLPEGTVELLAGAAQSAASSSNLQAWSLVAVEDAGKRAAFAKITGDQAHIATAPLFLVFLADIARLESIAAARGVPVAGVEYLELLLVGIVDAALAAQNAVLSAESIGLGTVYIGAIRNDLPAVAKLLDLPPRVMPVFGLTVGWPDPARRTSIKPRLPQAATLHRETYSAAPLPEGVARYEEAMAAFQRDQNLPAEPWAGKVVERVRTPEVLAGRHKLVETLRGLGFALK